MLVFRLQSNNQTWLTVDSYVYWGLMAVLNFICSCSEWGMGTCFYSYTLYVIISQAFWEFNVLLCMLSHLLLILKLTLIHLKKGLLEIVYRMTLSQKWSEKTLCLPGFSERKLVSVAVCDVVEIKYGEWVFTLRGSNCSLCACCLCTWIL